MSASLRIGVLLSAALLLGACGGQAAPNKPAPTGAAGGPQSVTLRTSDTMRFDPATVTVRANQPVQLTLDNTGAALVHDFTVDNLDGQRVHVEAQPSSRASGQFTP